MTPNDDPLARRALFVAFEGMGLLDLTGPLTVFWSASTFMKQQGRHGLRPAYGQPRQLHACAQLNRTCLSHRRRSAFRVPGSARRRGGHSCSFNWCRPYPIRSFQPVSRPMFIRAWWP